MTTLREAVREYLKLRRSLGFKLQEAGKGLLDFVTIHGRAQRSSYITAGVGARLGAATIDRCSPQNGRAA